MSGPQHPSPSPSPVLGLPNHNDPLFKSIGISLAVASGVFIGSSFIFKKKGLLQESKPGERADQTHSYLANKLWWFGMTLMIIGEVCNFVAYAFAQAILVTPLGALSVVISAVLSSIFLKERLNLQGKIGCCLCILGSVIIVVHSPDQQQATTIDEFKDFFIAPIFLTYAILAIIASGVVIWTIAPKYGDKNMLVYIGVCSLIGSLSVVTTQGIGTAIVTSIMGDNQVTHWFFWVLLVFVITTLVTEINYLNKALNLFNTAMVTPVYYVIFTGLTILSSALLFKGFTAPVISLVSVVLGFLVICIGIVCLQTSKSAVMEDTDDKHASLLGDSDYDPGASEIRASFGSLRRYSQSFQRGPSGSLHGSLPSHRRTRSGSSAGHLSRRGSHTASTALSPINEFDLSGNPTQPHEGEVSITMGEEGPHGVELSPTRGHQAIRFSEPEYDTPVIHTTSPSSAESLPGSRKSIQLDLPPPLSPLQHPIDYIKKQKRSRKSNKSKGDDTSSGKHLTVAAAALAGDAQNTGSTASRRSQNQLSVMDRFKLGLHSKEGSSSSSGTKSGLDDEDYVKLVGEDEDMALQDHKNVGESETDVAPQEHTGEGESEADVAPQKHMNKGESETALGDKVGETPSEA